MNNVLRFAGACALVIAASTAQAETLKIATEGAGSCVPTG